jgi:hypothetical protein
MKPRLVNEAMCFLLGCSGLLRPRSNAAEA